jgi:uracil-DNA glycosylase
VTRALGLRNAEYPFARAAVYGLDGQRTLFSSYHPSRYNLNTGRISAASFAAVFARIRELLR